MTNIFGHLPELLKSLKGLDPRVDDPPRCLCGDLIDSDDPDEAFCVECKVEGSMLRVCND